MNREIKFRAWNNTSVKHSMAYCGIEGIFGYHKSMGHPIMQFTGLKDLKGVDIYEGDIVAGETGSIRDIGEIRYDEDYATWLNFCHKSRSVLCENMPFPLWQSFHQPGTRTFRPAIEVIGNIYENKELLK